MLNQAKRLKKKIAEGFNLRLVIVLAISIVIGSAAIFVVYKFSLNARQKVISSLFTPIRSVGLEERSLSERDISGEGHNKFALRVAIAPVVSPEASLVLYKSLVDYLDEALGREAVLILRPSYAEINELIRNGRCDLAFVCSYPYIRGKLDFGMQVLVVPMMKGKVTYHSYLVVPSSSKAESLLDLKGMRFASADLLSTSGWLFPALWLKEHGEDPERFFSEHIIARSHDRSVYLVAYGYVDGAAVDSIVYEQTPEEMRAKTKVVLKSPPFGMPPVVIRSGIEKELKNELLRVLLNMHKEPKGNEALSPLGIDRFVIPDENRYNSVEEMVKMWESRE